jgi:hypothetical protein
MWMRAASGGRVGVRVAVTGAVLVLLAILLGGCETTAEKSARLERQAKRVALTQKGLSIARASTVVRVVSTAVLHSSGGAAAAVTVRNTSARALQAVPIAIVVKDAAGRVLFQNNAPGLEAALVSIPSLPPHGELTWVDDQVPASGAPASVSAVVGEVAGSATAQRIPAIDVEGLHEVEDPATGIAEVGTVRNHSQIAQRSLVIFAIARRGGAIVAAGRAVLSEVGPGAATPFQMFFIGDPRGAELQASAPPTTLG